ncbi:MAG TPA: tetratricopeptide repeat protein [Phycisphaerae bacterium]|nr:tetratricopeptide repeat protein [Phycisphaerae bacterium]
MRPLAQTARIAALVALALAVAGAGAQTVEQLEKQVRDDPTSIQSREALAEAYLRQCELEKSLATWRWILEQVPDHPRARLVVERLTLQKLDLDSHLDVLEKLIRQGIAEGTAQMLDAATRRAATDDQKAQLLALRGGLAALEGDEAAARAAYEAAMKLYPDTGGAARAAVALARLQAARGWRDEARRLLRGVIDNRKLQDRAAREEAVLELASLDVAGATRTEAAEAMKGVAAKLAVPEVKREAFARLKGLLVAPSEKWVPEAVDAAEAILRTDPPFEAAMAELRELAAAVAQGQDAPTLDRVLQALGALKFSDAALAREAQFLRAETLLARATIEEDAKAMAGRVGAAQKAIGELVAAEAAVADRRRLDSLRGRAHLVEAQKLLALEGPTQALPVLLEAKACYLEMLRDDPKEALARLGGIATLLEQVQEWEMAASLNREITVRFPHRPEGRDALLRVARLYEERLDAPMDALQVYAEYAARYPAELPYRQRKVGARLQRLGYANVLDFQKRNRLKPDGLFGPKTRSKLEEVEKAFSEIRLRDVKEEVLKGEFVHPKMFAIARRLEDAGRHHDAIVAYRLFLNLFPTKKDADDALLRIARLFGDNLLFDEALGAYASLMEDYPDGDKTSLAYVEAAACNENLGRWDKARELYELYAKKFPHYKHVGLAKDRLALLDEIQQYADFIADNPENPKVAEAQYQIATIFYKQFKNYAKAAVEFEKVAENYPRHVRAADALFTGGTAQLHAENFPAARTLYERLVKSYPDNRLADDAQYWIGHTYEYSARAVGKLDERRIVLKRRSLRERERLVADLDLRRLYSPAAQPGHEVSEEVWGGDTLGVLTSGSNRDRVNADLFRAIRAYRKVVENFKMGDMAGEALLRIGTIYTKYLKDPEKGIEAYQELLAHYPASEQAVDALFEVGGYYLKNKKYDEAVKAYQQFTYNYPQNPRVEDAMLAIARCWAEQKAWDKALDAYRSYLSKFPDGKQAEFAKAQIAWIRMYHF